MKNSAELVFLDSRDLIACVEHGTPCSSSVLALDLIHNGAAILLTYTTVAEFVPKDGDHERAFTLIDALEMVPHRFVRQPSAILFRLEFREAVEAFREGRRPNSISRLVSSWWRTFWKPADDADLIVDARGPVYDAWPLAVQVKQLLRNPGAMTFGDVSEELQRTVDDDRLRLGKARGELRSFLAAVIMKLNEIGADPGDLSKFVKWLREDPTICPGWRIAYDAYEEFRADQAARAKSGHIPDLAHVAMAPYCDSMTLDKTWRTYVDRAGKRLRQEGIATPYHSRIHPDLASIRRAWMN